MAECPRCDAVIREGAVSCACGWRARARKGPQDVPPLEHIPCAHETCDFPAKVKILTATGWAKLCLPHYERHFEILADKRFTELDLDMWQDETREAWRKRVFAYIRGKVKPKTFEDAEAA